MLFLIVLFHQEQGLVSTRLISASEDFDLSGIVKEVCEDLPEDGQDHTYKCLSRLLEKVCERTPKKLRVITMSKHEGVLVDEFCFLLEEK